MKHSLNIAGDFTLPLEAVTETFAILAKRGAGKTYTGKVLAEEMIAAQLPVAVIDPIGVWWGLRSSADGLSPGLPVIIFGGDHQDVPLEPNSGRLLADVLIDERFPAVFDVSLLTVKEQLQWMTDFSEHLYHRNRNPLHLILDEVDLWAPQNPAKGSQRLLEAIEAIVRRGRARGLGVTLITQRAASLNKNVLTQTEVLIALRMNYKSDVDALDAWVKQHGDTEKAGELKASLPSLPTGTAWIWSPSWLDKLQKIQVRRAQTFDSSATPKAGDVRIEPREFAPVDLARLGERIAATLEKAKDDDPADLKRRLDEAHKLLAERPATVEVREIHVSFPVPVLAEGELERLEALAEGLVADAKDVMNVGMGILATLRTLQAPAPTSVPPLAPQPPVPELPAPEPEPEPDSPPAPKRPSSNAPVVSGLPSPQAKILMALSNFEALGLSSVHRAHVAVLCGVSPKSSGYRGNLSALSTRGFLSYVGDGELALTDEGRDATPELSTIAQLPDLWEAWYSYLPEPQAAILRVLVHIYPRKIARERLAERVGVSAKSSGFRGNMSALSTLDLVEYPDTQSIAATAMMFPLGAP